MKLLPFLFLFLSVAAFAEEPTGIKMETLLKADKSWDGVAYEKYPDGKPEISMLKISIPAHTKMKWHTHPMPNAAYVLSGEITVEKKNGETKHIKAGEVLPETVNSLHRGTTGDLPVELIVFYAGSKGMKLFEAE